jgi:predicted nucleic acid-binding protein
MTGPFTIDASVFLNAFNRREHGHDVSLRLLRWLQAEAIPIIAPTLVLPEVAGAVSRGHRDAGIGHRLAAGLSRLPHIVLVPLDRRLAGRVSETASLYRLRGSDAVYAAVAMQFGTALVTLDAEQRRRVADVVVTRSPGELMT